MAHNPLLPLCGHISNIRFGPSKFGYMADLRIAADRRTHPPLTR